MSCGLQRSHAQKDSHDGRWRNQSSILCPETDHEKESETAVSHWLKDDTLSKIGATQYWKIIRFWRCWQKRWLFSLVHFPQLVFKIHSLCSRTFIIFWSNWLRPQRTAETPVNKSYKAQSKKQSFELALQPLSVWLIWLKMNWQGTEICYKPKYQSAV